MIKILDCYNHRQDVLYRIFNMKFFSMRKNWTAPSIKMTYGWGHSGWPILILTGEEYFLFLIMIGEDITQVLMNIEWRSIFFLLALIPIPSWTGSMKWRSFSTWFMSPHRSMSSSWYTNSRKEQPHGGTNYKSQGDAKASHPWWYRDAWSYSYKIDSSHLIINKSFTINLNIANKVQGLLRRIRRSSTVSHYNANLSMTEEQTAYISDLKYLI